MKRKIMHHIIAFLAVIPGFLVFNDSDVMWPNMLGLGYIITICALTKWTRPGRSAFLKIYKSLK